MTDEEKRVGSLAEGNVTQARKRIAVGLLSRDEAGRPALGARRGAYPVRTTPGIHTNRKSQNGNELTSVQVGKGLPRASGGEPRFATDLPRMTQSAPRERG